MSRGLLALILGTGMAVSAVAHHSISAEFDTEKRIEFTGKVVKIDWLNPHTYTHVEVEEPDGSRIVYRVEGGPPNALYRSGWRENDLPIGTTVTVTGAMARNPESTNIGSASITDADGVRMWSGQNPNR